MSQKTILIIGAGEHISSEDWPRSRETILLAATAVALVAGTVLGQALGTQTLTTTAGAGNAGNATMNTPTVDKTQVAAGKIGIVFTDATHFVVEGPDGREIGTGTTGAAFNKGGVAFTITAGATPMAANDRFDITNAVAADGAYAPINPAATDGTQNYAGHLYEGRDISAGTQKAVANVRSTVVNGNKVTYVTAPTMTQLRNIEAQAAAKGVLTRY
jgi:Bacteriophage lambda head decoration protein D